MMYRDTSLDVGMFIRACIFIAVVFERKNRFVDGTSELERECAGECGDG